jgi:general secretion pathway protein J
MRAAESPRTRGFTLIELLVALFITAIIFAMGYGAINQALKDRETLDARQSRLTAVQNAMRVIVQDFTQLAPRPVRDALGQSSLPCLMGGPNGIALTAGGMDATTLGGSSPNLGALGSSFGSSSSSSSSESSSSSSSASGANGQALDLVAFTRAGWANPAGIQRPALARVSYRLENGTLRRVTWPELDVAQATVPIVRDLLAHVRSVRFRYLTDARQWTDVWPPVTTVSSSPLAGNQMLRWRPLAVEVTLELDDWGKVVRIIEVPT